MLIIEEVKSVHDVMRVFHDWLFASIHPEPPEDVEANERNGYYNYIQTYDPTRCHLCAVDPRTILQMPSTEKNEPTL